MSKLTRRMRYQRTASALRHILHFGRVPNTRATYYDGYTPFELWADSYGVWIKLIRGNRFIAIVDYHSVRCIRGTIYLTILEDFARRTERKFIVADSFTPTSRRFAPINRANPSTFGDYDDVPYSVNRQGRTVRAHSVEAGHWGSLSSVDSFFTPVMSEEIDLSEIAF